MERQTERRQIFLGQEMPRKSYTLAAEIIERHPGYQDKKQMVTNIMGMAIEEYVAFCRQRAKENYTNDTAETAQREFEEVLSMLNG